MKIFSWLWIVIIFTLLGVIGGIHFSTPAPSAAPTVEKAKTAVDIPQALIVPKINVNTKVELVGEDNEGKMDVPKQAENVGWYQYGSKPGEQGSAVLAGHLDTITGVPAVFYNLDQLQVGDEVIVVDQSGKRLTFEVTRSQVYPFDQVPLTEIFNSNDKQRLNLITCTGTWNVGARNYSNRLVVYTQLKSS